jgi:hypothetical protein
VCRGLRHYELTTVNHKMQVILWQGRAAVQLTCYTTVKTVGEGQYDDVTAIKTPATNSVMAIASSLDVQNPSLIIDKPTGCTGSGQAVQYRLGGVQSVGGVQSPI